MRPAAGSSTALCLLLLLTGAASGNAAAPAPDARTVIAGFERNRQALRAYRWKSKTQVMFAGEVVELELFAARYDADGTLRKDPLASQPESNSTAAAVHKRPAKKLEKKIAETRKHLESLIESYTEIGGDRLQSAFADARVTQGGPGETTLIQTRDLILRGDSLKVMVDAQTLRPRRFEILTSSEGEPVQLRTEFVELADGPSYPARVTVDTEIKEKKMVVTTENFDYVRTP